MITVCFGLIAIFFMAHTPAQAKFLTEEERVVALHRMRSDAHGATPEEDVGQERLNWRRIRMALLSPNTWFYFPRMVLLPRMVLPAYSSLRE